MYYFYLIIFIGLQLSNFCLGQLGQAPEVNPNSNNIPIVSFQVRSPNAYHNQPRSKVIQSLAALYKSLICFIKI